MPEQERTVDEQIAEAEAKATEHREAGRELEEKEALERVAVLKAARGARIAYGDDQGHEDNKARG
jgi:hypothetical protein